MAMMSVGFFVNAQDSIRLEWRNACWDSTDLCNSTTDAVCPKSQLISHWRAGCFQAEFLADLAVCLFIAHCDVITKCFPVVVVVIVVRVLVILLAACCKDNGQWVTTDLRIVITAAAAAVAACAVIIGVKCFRAAKCTVMLRILFPRHPPFYANASLAKNSVVSTSFFLSCTRVDARMYWHRKCVAW